MAVSVFVKFVEFVANKADHEFHENYHCDLDVIGLKYNSSQSLRPRCLTPTLNCTRFLRQT